MGAIIPVFAASSGTFDGAEATITKGVPFTVVGIIGDTEQLPELLAGVIVPRSTARDAFGPPPANGQGQVIVRTRLGAAKVIADLAPLALRPDRPDLLTAIPHPIPESSAGG